MEEWCTSMDQFQLAIRFMANSGGPGDGVPLCVFMCPSLAFPASSAVGIASFFFAIPWFLLFPFFCAGYRISLY